MNVSLKHIIPCLLLLLGVDTKADTMASQIHNLIDQYAAHKVFSGAVLVSRDGETIYQEGHGLANHEWNIPNTSDTKFIIASVTKTFTSALILKLVEQNKLSLNDTIDKYLPDFPKEKSERITVGHLLGHRAGFPRWFSLPGWSEGKFNAHLSKAEIIRVIGEQKLLSPPGERYSYTNLDYFLLGIIIEKVSNSSLSEALQSEIFAPLNMNDTGMVNHTSIIDKRASGYKIKESGGYEHPRYLNLDMFGAGAAMHSTVQDLFRWERSFYGNILLSEKSKAQLFNPKNHYAWYAGELPINNGNLNPSIHNVDGELPGFGAFITRFIDQEHSIIILSNNAMNNAEKIRMTIEIADILYQTGNKREKTPLSFLLSKALYDGELNEMLEHYKNNVAKFDASEPAIKAIAQQLMWSDQLEGAIEILNLNSEIFRNSFDAQHSAAKAYEKNGQNILALRYYQKALAIDPSNEELKQKVQSLQ